MLKRFFPEVGVDQVAVNCHHNYVNTEKHFGQTVLLTRKGAVRAQTGDLGIVPGSMGGEVVHRARQGEPGQFLLLRAWSRRAMSRNAARKRFTLDDHAQATAHVECRKDAGVIDETPAPTRISTR